MPEKIKNIVRKIKRLTLFPSYLKVKIQNTFKTLPDNRKKILFTLDDKKLYLDNDGTGRFPFLLLNAFSEAGYSVYILNKGTFLAFVHLEIYGRGIYHIKNVKVISKPPSMTKDMIYAFDDIHGNLLRKQWKKLVYVNVLKPAYCKVGELITIPFFMHPVIYYFGLHEATRSLSINERKLRIFFGGSVVKESYNRPFLKLQGQLTRFEALDGILKYCAKAKYFKDAEELLQLINGSQYLNECRILDTGRARQISPSDWLNVLSCSDFFLCFSGVEYPMCHNAIEAMAVGSIPIISHYDWFDPPLEHEKNAIIFSGVEDLVKKVNGVFDMDADRIKRMRHNVIRYYDEHLSSKSFVRKFESSFERLNTLMLFPRLVCSESGNNQGKIIYEKLKYGLKDYL